MQRTFKWIGIIFLAAVLLNALLLVFFDWNWLRGPISSRISSKLDRRFEIRGDLKVRYILDAAYRRQQNRTG